MTNRIERLRRALRERELPAALITSPVNVGYLTGFTGSTALLLVTPERARLLTDSRYATQARGECPGIEVAVLETGGRYEERAAAEARELGVDRLVVESEAVTLRRFRQFREKMEAITLEAADDLVGPLRLTKDPEEIERTRRACAIADRAFDHLLTLLRPGVIERDLALEIEYFMKKQGAEKEAFDTIVASGARSALPHGRASEKAIETGDLVTFDFGCRLDGYHSDLTRTVVVGRASDRQREVYRVVLEAQLAALAAIRPGVPAKEVDTVAREIIGGAGYGDHFGHSLGHSLGRDVHDAPGLSQHSEFELAPGMIMTVEPGIYLEGWGGVRIEDDVVVTEEGCEVLTHAPKELIEV